MDSKQHIETVLNQRIRPIFEKAAERIDALKPGEKVPATELAKELAKEVGMTGPQLYPTLKLLFDNYPGVVIKKGAHGGIEKLPVGAPVPQLPAADVVEEDTADEV